MSDERPQIYLITPPAIELASFPAQLSTVLDTTSVACLRLALASTEEDAIIRAVDALLEIAHARDIPLVIDSHVGLVTRLGLDGVHLQDGARSVRKTRSALGADTIVGAYCGASRHEGLTACESGADYAAFGPLRETRLGFGDVAPADLFNWWSEVIEVPVVAEGSLTVDLVRQLAPVTDFFALGTEVWSTDDPARSLTEFARAIG